MHELAQHIADIVRAAEEGDTYQCITVASEADPSVWAQVTWDMLNASYPFSDSPATKTQVQALSAPEDFALVEWEPHSHITWEHGSTDPKGIAAFTLSYLRTLYGELANTQHLWLERQVL